MTVAQARALLADRPDDEEVWVVFPSPVKPVPEAPIKPSNN